ncbi:leucine-rich repeat neuronal protein 3 [Lucilia sericata]|uniref:leucine-rich repeat neuronal protein 3 n=1 Tax=Lucilia sericata TaxID=13632 RepID=UPI0018A830F6|nr:leucine-rich repeat neuronal protein 3 [Lucilia sericata]
MRVNSVAIGLSVVFALNITLLIQSVMGDDWSLSCASNCTCKWTNGKKSAICSSLQLTAIPTTLSTELQVLVLNDNHIPYLNREEFANLELLNLQRIYLKKSEVQYVHKEAFKDLKILVEIDLSDNRIEMLDKDTFMGNDRLRILYLNGNPLKKLVAYQFPVLPHLRTLDLHDCLLSYIDPMALANLNMLEFLYLKNNLLENLSEYVFQHMTSLKTLVLDENPWQCNCKLRKFRSWYVNSKLYSESLLCKGPPYHKDKTWDSVEEEQFGCSPKVEIFNNEDVQNIEIGSNVTFSCLVYGDPLPQIYWELNGKILDSENVMFEAETIASDKLWSNLTVFNMTSLDAGTYVCSGTNVVGVGSQNISIYLTEIVQHVLVKTPETFWYFGLIMGTFGTVFLLILISFVACLCKRTTRQRRHPSKTGVKPSVSFNDQEKKLLDLSITTTTNDRVDSCLDNNHSTATAMSKAESVMGFEPIEIHSSDNHRSSVHGHHALMMGTHHQLPHPQQMQHNHSHMPPTSAAGSHVSNHPQQLMAVSDGSCSVVGIPTSLATSVNSDGHNNHISEEFPLNVGVFPPPPEFCSNIVANPTYGNIFISVSVTQDMLDGADISMYPDLLNIPQRLQDNGMSSVVVTQQTSSNSNQANSHGADTMSPPPSAQQHQQQQLTSSMVGNHSSVNVNSFATLPRNNQRRGILKKDSSLQHQHQQQLPQPNLYTHDEIVSYHNLDTTYSQGYQEHQTELIGLPPPPPPPSVKCHHGQHSTNATSKSCSGCMSTALQPPSACPSPPKDATPLRPLYKTQNGSACLKYDNMGRRITASGNSTLSLPDEERLESETLFNDGNPLTKTPASKVATKLQDCQSSSPTPTSGTTQNKAASKNIDTGSEFVSL